MNSYISGIKPNHNLLCDYANPLSLYFIKHLSLLLISSSSCFLRWSVYFIFLKELSILFTFSSHWHVCTVPIIMSLVFVICSLSFFCYSALSEICPFYFLFFKEQALVLLILLLFFRISIISALLIDSFLPNSFPFCSLPRLCALLVNFSLLFSYKDVRFWCLYLHTPNSDVSAFFFFPRSQGALISLWFLFQSLRYLAVYSELCRHTEGFLASLLKSIANVTIANVTIAMYSGTVVR